MGFPAFPLVAYCFCMVLRRNHEMLGGLCFCTVEGGRRSYILCRLLTFSEALAKPLGKAGEQVQTPLISGLLRVLNSHASLSSGFIHLLTINLFLLPCYHGGCFFLPDQSLVSGREVSGEDSVAQKVLWL